MSYRGKDYKANLFMPSDALPLVLMMLGTAKYRFVTFEAAAGSKDAPISRFYFSKTIEDDSELAASWDDAWIPAPMPPENPSPFGALSRAHEAAGRVPHYSTKGGGPVPLSLVLSLESPICWAVRLSSVS